MNLCLKYSIRACMAQHDQRVDILSILVSFRWTVRMLIDI